MKSDIFKSYAKQVCLIFSIDEETLFTKSKRRDIADARHLLYYLCSIRPMRPVYIQEYMADEGYKISHSSIIHGINVVKNKIQSDLDYVAVVDKVQKCVTA